MKKRILALSLTTVMALSTLVGVLVAHKMTIEPVMEETAMVVDEEPSRAVLAANYTQVDLDRVAKEAFDIINNIRKENGLSSYTWGGDFISDIRSEEITKNFCHTSATIPISNIDGENCARTNSLNAQHVVDLWMNSPGHKRAIMHDLFSYAQMSVYEKDGRFYWSNDFFATETYKARLTEYESGMYRHREETETKLQPSSAAAEVKQEEQKPATEVKQEVKQETKPGVKEEQKPVTTPEVKQDNQTPASKVEVVKEEEQKPVPSTTAETKPSNSATTNVSGDNKDNSDQKTSTNRPRPRGSGATAEKQEEIPGLTIYYDEETDQRYEIVVAPGQSREEAFREQVTNKEPQPSQQQEEKPKTTRARIHWVDELESYIAIDADDGSIIWEPDEAEKERLRAEKERWKDIPKQVVLDEYGDRMIVQINPETGERRSWGYAE